MNDRIEFFFDFISPYSYIAYNRIDWLKEQTGAEIVFRPFFLGGVMNDAGNSPPANVAAKGKWMWTDLKMHAARYGIEMEMNPSFPFNTVNLMRGCFPAEDEGVLRPYCDTCFRAVWAEGRNMADKETAIEALNEAGLDGEKLMAGAAAPEAKEKLKANSDEAVRRGAFGAPTFFIGEKMYFGQDRMEFVADALKAA
jgi:2-hydroxychromene-2-carboxylate isomerase